MPLPSFHMIDGAPRPVAPFSHATEVDGWVFLTGQMPTDPNAPDAPLPEGVAAQTIRTVDNLKIVLHGMGLGLEHVVQARVYLTHFDRDYGAMNAIWPSFFAQGKLPARTCIGVSGLAVGALVEIDMVARRP
jgi:2-iminobutanoate/2-iminopropanoate deaminase